LSDYQPHILVVDDSALLRRQVLAEFDDLNASTVEAEDGISAIAKIHQHKPDLITLDIEMPKMDGYGVCRMLSSNAATLGIPVIMISSKPSDEERLHALEAGAVEYFVKPFEPGTLKRLAQTLLGRVRANRDKHILSVSNERELRLMLDASLRRNGYQHECFEQPAQLLQALREKPCNLLLLDFRLPGHGAYQVLDALKTYGSPSTKVIALASMSARRDLVNAFYAGASDFVRVPFFTEELLARVERQLYVQNEESTLRDLATVDALTRVANRGELMRRAAIEVSRAVTEGTPLGVLLVDIDHFKRVNDELGHAVGDDVLRAVAQELRSRVRDTDFVGRYGGEEFVALLPGASNESLRAVAERLREAVERLSVNAPGETVHVTVSIGGQSWHPEGLPPNIEFASLVHGADKALYQAKEEGRNRWITCPPPALSVS